MRRKLLTLFAITAGICSLVSAKQLIGLLFTDYLYQKDFVQFFLMGHALRAGANLYAPLPQLAAQFDPNLNQWLNVSAYPPIVAVIGLPLSYLPYFWSVIAWLMFELVCLAAAIMLIVKQFGGRAAATPVLIVVAAFIGWRPVYIDLYLGQLMIPILLLLTLCWLALKAEKDGLALYKQLLELVRDRSVLLEEYARRMISEEELHIGEVNKMLRKPGDIGAV